MSALQSGFPSRFSTRCGIARTLLSLVSLSVLIASTPGAGVRAAPNARADARLGQAVTWATRELVSSDRWIEGGDTLCGKFVEAAFGVTAQYPTAYDMYHALGRTDDASRHTLAGLRDAPPGAIVFFAPNARNGEAGHVGVYLGDGAFIGVVTNGGVRVHGVGWWNDHIAPFLGWAYPRTDWPGSGASGYSAPKAAAATTVFTALRRSSDTLAPNLWGPAIIAPRPEPYRGFPGEVRLVQYFDKGRMELGADSAATSGLLVTEMVKGRIQVGDNAFQSQAPPDAPIAGDADGHGPTYAGIAAKGGSLLAAAANRGGARVTTLVSAAGEAAAEASSDPALSLAAFDDATKHNLPQAFADYRARAGMGTIGYAVSEPFLAQVKVADTRKQVMAQLFERRVLTYTASNPDAFKVEMGNIGQHYYHWRYGQ